MALTSTLASALASPARGLTLVWSSGTMGARSRPLAATGSTLGASGLTLMLSLALLVVLRLPSPSRAVAATLSVKLLALLVVTAALAGFYTLSLHDALPILAVKL